LQEIKNQEKQKLFPEKEKKLLAFLKEKGALKKWLIAAEILPRRFP
jgi:hypothetical protein